MDFKDAPQIIEHISQNVTYSPFETRWIPCSARFVVLGNNPNSTGVLQVYELDDGKLKLLHNSTKADGLKCGTFGASLFEKRHLATGDYKGQLSIWDLEQPDKAIFSVNAHKSIINSIDGIGGLNIGGGAPEIVTGSRDGCVKIWDPRQNTPVASVEPAPGSSVRDCWAVAFGNSYNDEERCVVSGYDNGDVKMLDLRTNKLRWETNVKSGVVSLDFDRKDIQMNKLLCTTLEGRFRLFDLRTYHSELGYSSLVEKAHKSTVWFGRHLPQNRDVFMTCGGGTLSLYQYNYPDQRSVKDENGQLKGVMGTVKLHNSKRLSEQPIMSFDWSPDKTGLCVMGALDQTVRLVQDRIICMARRAQKLEKVRVQLDEFFSIEKFYEAQQLYKTLQARLVSGKSYTEAINLMVEGAQRLLEHKQIAAAAELAMLVVETMVKSEAKCTPENVETIRKVSSLFPKGAETQQITLLKAALKWSMEKGGPAEGEPAFHEDLALAFWRQQDYTSASRHFARSGNQAHEHAAMLVEWARKGYPSERDLFIARAVMQYACLRNLDAANTVLADFKASFAGEGQADSLDTPLMNFVSFLLRTLERDAAPLFNMLRQKYQISLARDPAFTDYLNKIGEIFFGIKAPEGFLDSITKLF